MSKKILIFNCGSSSIKYEIISMPEKMSIVTGLIERIGSENAQIIQKKNNGEKHTQTLALTDYTTAFTKLIATLIDPHYGVITSLDEIKATGHRVVHGGELFTNSTLITHDTIDKLNTISHLAPLHNPVNILGIQEAQKLFPNVPHCISFDTSFHQTMPPKAYMYGLPYEFYKKNQIRSYGMHGTSHKYISYEAANYLELEYNKSTFITCHLGNGSSIAAIENGKCIDTSMGFTPLDGLLMGTRSGSLDPAIIFYLHKHLHLSIDDIENILIKKSGFLGVSGVSHDMRDVEKAASEGNQQAQLAIDIFNYRIIRYIGMYTAALQKPIDAIIFTGGIGENGPEVREQVGSQLKNINCIIDKQKNIALGRGNCGIFSAQDSPIKLMVIPTREELQIAIETYSLAFGG